MLMLVCPGEDTVEDARIEVDVEAYFSISNFGALIELDKAVYNWTDTVYIHDHMHLTTTLTLQPRKNHRYSSSSNSGNNPSWKDVYIPVIKLLL